MMTDAVALAKERSAAKTAGFWYKFKIGVAVFLKYFSLIFVAFMMLLPLVSCFVTAAKTDKEYQSTSVMDMPKNWFNFDNYVQAFVASNMAVAVRNSIILVVVVLHNLLGYLTGYAVGKALKLDSTKCRAISIEVGMQNSGLATSLAAAHFAQYPLATIPGAVFSVWHNISGAVLANFYARTADKQ